jgi:predicted dehydrogenase
MSELRAAVIGAGILGRRHARVFHEIEGSRLVAVADHSLSRAQAAAQTAGAHAYPDADQMLNEVDCDVVSVATPDHLHLAPVMSALRAGKHVLVEKPLATSPADARAMIAEAQRRGLVLQVNYSQRYVPEYAWLKEQIAAGTIGTPAMIISSKQDTIYVPTRMITWAAATSPIFFMSSHDIDLVTWFLDARADTVVAHESRGALEALGVPVHDGVDALVKYENGVVANFHSSWILPESYPTITVDRMTIIGTTGMLHYESRDRSVACFATTGGRVVTFSGPQTANEVEGRIRGAFRSSLEGFLSAARSGLEPETAAQRTLHVVDIQAAILDAARRQESVSLRNA